MSKQPKYHAGNTTSEYAIILGLIALSSIGALSLMGNSLSSQLNKVNQGNAHQAMAQMSNLNFDTNKSSSSKSESFQTLGSNAYELPNVSSGGTNATSMDGTAITAVKASYKFANKLLAMAAQTDDPGLKAWYQEAANRTLKLAGSQAAYELASNGIIDPDNQLSNLIGIKNNETIGTDDAVKSIIQWQESLKAQLNLLAVNHTASAADLKEAHDLAVSVLDNNNEQYSDTIVKTDISQATALDPDVNIIKKEVANTDIIDNLGIATTVETGLTMDAKAK